MTLDSATRMALLGACKQSPIFIVQGVWVSQKNTVQCTTHLCHSCVLCHADASAMTHACLVIVCYILDVCVQCTASCYIVDSWCTLQVPTAEFCQPCTEADPASSAVASTSRQVPKHASAAVAAVATGPPGQAIVASSPRHVPQATSAPAAVASASQQPDVASNPGFVAQAASAAVAAASSQQPVAASNPCRVPQAASAAVAAGPSHRAVVPRPAHKAHAAPGPASSNPAAEHAPAAAVPSSSVPSSAAMPVHSAAAFTFAAAENR